MSCGKVMASWVANSALPSMPARRNCSPQKGSLAKALAYLIRLSPAALRRFSR